MTIINNKRDKTMNLLRLKQLVVVLTLLLLTNGLSAQVTQAAIAKSVISSDGVKYLGDGYNSVTKEFVYANQALKFPNGAVETTDGIQSFSSIIYANSRYELEKEISSIFSQSIGVGIGMVSAESSLTKEMVNKTQFSLEKTTVIAYWRQIDKKIYCNGLPKLKDEALTLLQNDPKKFVQTYGDQYVSSVTLGRMFYIVYQAETSGLSESRKSAIKKAMGLNVGYYVGGSLENGESQYIKETMTGVKTTCSAIGYGIPYFTGIDSKEDIDNIVNQVGLSEPAVLAKEFVSFSQTSNGTGYSFFDITEYVKMINGAIIILTWNIF
jgi:hypothetical protein